ncbi:thioredoxin family protein [Cupriavidus agavae]|uniref:Cytochrome oxidase Cu insertion factor (SCO1/SenC/PrrC family) n=1 Tax=Cupriavidus agavae TaxID=1001822 RepID=A0A4Q7R862_9BURK|nr:thioredoxin family protein [Cupriavidus agavae]RZT29035.1 cytochrome oxidase Cu insertion factor (SCO1/SenC/PrrC family) [Cupriavidus agavae]
MRRTLVPALFAAICVAILYNFAAGAFASSPRTGDQGAAPEFAGITHWLNSPPLTMQQLKGKVVLVDFWTYACGNCVNTLPYVTKWYDKYKDQGLVVVGVHTPEFPFEKSTANVQAALKEYGIRYPVAQDNNYATWSAYHNQYWPALYLVDANGRIVYQHYGEGSYGDTEAAIRKLLAERNAGKTDKSAEAVRTMAVAPAPVQ